MRDPWQVFRSRFFDDGHAFMWCRVFERARDLDRLCRLGGSVIVAGVTAGGDSDDVLAAVLPFAGSLAPIERRTGRLVRQAFALTLGPTWWRR